MTLGPDAARDALVDEGARRAIERDVLLPFLARQRWFAGKARQPTSARIGDWGVLGGAGAPAFLWLVDVGFADGTSHRYFMPVAGARGAEAARIEHEEPTSVVARLPGARDAVLHRVLSTVVAPLLLEAIEAGRQIPLRHGVVHAHRTSAFATVLRGAVPAELPVRQLSGEQSNTSLCFGDRLILKLIRRVEPGLNPDFEIGAHLTRNGFCGAPRLAGALEYVAGDERSIIGVLHAFVEHESNAWEQSVAGVRALLDRAGAQPAPAPVSPGGTGALDAPSPDALPPSVREALAGDLDIATRLGRRTAELHLALADAEGDPAFEPEPLRRADCATLAEAMQENAARAIDALSASLPRVPAGLAALACQLVDARPSLVGRFAQLAVLEPACTRIRVHGDYHLGQVLCARGDVIILDFEGEPLRPIEDRRRKHPAMKDVAGMLRSFSYASYAALFSHGSGRPGAVARLEPWARMWQADAAATFLRAYLDTAGGASFVPRHPAALDVLLRAYLLDKACYELVYELNNRPDWLGIPISGLLDLK